MMTWRADFPLKGRAGQTEANQRAVSPLLLPSGKTRAAPTSEDFFCF
jgi:hypothetical protein